MRIEEIITDDLAERVKFAMASDKGRGVPRPTHAVIGDGGQVIGAYSLHFAPCLFFWMHTKRGNALSSYRALQVAIGQVMDSGWDTPLLLIEDESPYTPFVERLGFQTMESGRLMIFNGG